MLPLFVAACGGGGGGGGGDTPGFGFSGDSGSSNESGDGAGAEEGSGETGGAEAPPADNGEETGEEDGSDTSGGEDSDSGGAIGGGSDSGGSDSGGSDSGGSDSGGSDSGGSDSGGDGSESNDTQPVGVNRIPSVTFTSPQSSSDSADLPVEITATDEDGFILNVALYIDDTLVRVEGSAPYQWGTANTNKEDPALLSLAPGTYQLTAVATDNQGDTGSATIPVTVSASSSSSGAPDPATGTNSRSVGQLLNSGERLESTDGQYRFTLQGDGNLVLRDASSDAIWSSRTNGSAAERLVLQGDGNLVLYTGAGAAVWASGTVGSGATALIMNNSGTLGLYAGERLVWSAADGAVDDSPGDTGDDGSGDTGGSTGGGTGGGSVIDDATATNSRSTDGSLFANERLESTANGFRFNFQGDGNLVLRNGSGDALWSTSTQGLGGEELTLQADGNLVLYTASMQPVWSSGTAGSGATLLMLDDYGVLGLYRGDIRVWGASENGVETSGDSAIGNPDGNVPGGGNGGGMRDSSDGTGSSLGRFSAPDPALYALNRARQRVVARPVDTNFSGNGHAQTWDGRIWVITRTDGWFINTFRPERIGRNDDGTPIFDQGAFGERVLLESNTEAPDVQHNWLTVMPDPDANSDNPYPSDASGNFQLNGTHATYKALVYHTASIDGGRRQMVQRKATFVVQDAYTSNADIFQASFDTSVDPLILENGDPFSCIEPTSTMDARLILCQGHPDNDGRIDNIVYSWTVTPGDNRNWTIPRSLADMYLVDRDVDVDGVPFRIRYPLAEFPLTDAEGVPYEAGAEVKGAYPWVGHDGTEVFYQASRDGVTGRRTGTSVVGRWTGGIVRHIDGPINPWRHRSTRLFLSSPGAFTTMWTPYKDQADPVLPYSTRGPAYPIFGSNSHDYMEVGFDDYLDGNYVMYLGMNEQLDRLGNYQVDASNDTSGNFNNATLVGAQFPLEFNGQDEIVGIHGQAIYFNGGSYLDITRNRGWDSLQGGLTVDLFVKLINPSSGLVPLFQVEDGIELYLDDSVVNVQIQDQFGGSAGLSGTAIGTGEWVHLAFTYSPLSGRMALYVNALEVDSGPATGLGTLRTSGAVTVGPWSGGNLMLLDEVKVSNVVRQPYEIAYYAYVPSNVRPGQDLLDSVPDHLAPLKGNATSVDRFSTDAAALGEDLFSDVILSLNNSTSCATCHDPLQNFTDGRAIAQGNEPTDAGRRNTPTLVNRLFSSVQGWSGNADSLDLQALNPIPAVHEMNLPLSDAVARLRAHPTYGPAFQSVYGEEADATNLAAALASFQATQFSPRSAVDDFKDGDVNALSASERRGLVLFEGKARCSGCHAGRNYTDESFRNNGLVTSGDIGRADVTGRDRDYKLFKVPTLRGVSETAPYMHNGSFATLEAVVNAYNAGSLGIDVADSDVRPLELTPGEITDLVNYLLAL